MEVVFSGHGVVFHCQHFVLAQPFLYNTTVHRWKRKPAFEPMSPYLAGVILEQALALAVIHALPICEFIDDDFVPRHTVFLITYFSEQPERALDEFDYHGAQRYDAPATSYAIPPYGNELHWMDLPYWVERGMLYWVDGQRVEENYDPKTCIQTHAVDAFPYGDVRKLVSGG